MVMMYPEAMWKFAAKRFYVLIILILLTRITFKINFHLLRIKIIWIGKEMHRGTRYRKVGFRLICWTGFQFIWNLSTFKIFWSKSVISILNWIPLFSFLRYQCLPWTWGSNQRFTRDNETNTDVLIYLFQLKYGVSLTREKLTQWNHWASPYLPTNSHTAAEKTGFLLYIKKIKWFI